MSIESIYDNLQTYYNTDILSTIKDKQVLNVFKNISIKNINANTGNETLIRLVYNYFYNYIPEMVLPAYISGPYSLTYHKDKKYNKKIYILGELHGTTDTCTDIPNSFNITQLLESVFDNTYCKVF